MQELVYNWGLYPKNRGTIHIPNNYDEIVDLVHKKKSLIARGNGRCYGDASLSSDMISTKKLNQFLLFDKTNGILTCQSGVLLSEILNFILPFGFFLPVTPGTKFITIGGALASDVHGKNHHIDGVFSDHVLSFKLIDSFGSVIDIFPGDDLFARTSGGMGLTGIIVEVTFKLKKIESSFIKQTSARAKNLVEVFQLFDKYKHATYSVAWIDCLAKRHNVGRSVFLMGEHAKCSEIKNQNYLKLHKNPIFTVPFFFPNWILNPLSIKVFNFLFYNKPSSNGETIMHYDSFFYPLDKINFWNKIYGRNGFIQYQFVLPLAHSFNGIKEVLDILSEHNLGSFLAVLKLFGKSHEDRYLHFPMEGYTLALDIKITDKIWDILNQLDAIVNKYNGKIYLTKDCRMSYVSFKKQYKNRLTSSKKMLSHQMIRLSSKYNHSFLIIGANSDIAKAAALKYLIEFPSGHLILVSRNISELSKFVAENKIEQSTTILFYDILNQADNNSFIKNLPAKPNWIMYAAGVLVDNVSASNDSEICINSAYVNYTGAMKIINDLINDNNPYLSRIIGISSIAGLRGRSSNYIYGSAKCGFHQYLFGLRQSLKATNILVQALTPGIVKTKMTKNISQNRFANSPNDVANVIFSKNKSFEIYPNFFWWGMSKIVKYAPEFIIAKL